MTDQAKRIVNLRNQLAIADRNTPVTVDLSPLVELAEELLRHELERGE